MIQATDPDRSAGDPARLRVLFSIDSMGIGGTELNAIRTAEQLVARGVEVRLLCLKESGALSARYRDAGIPVHYLGLSNLYGLGAVRRAGRLIRFLRREQFDVVHCHDMYSNILTTACARLAGAPLIIASRRWAADYPARRYRYANRVAFRWVDRVLGNSPAVAASLTRDDGVPPGRVVTIPNFLEDARFLTDREPARGTLRASLGLPADAVVVGCVARLNPVKDHPTLLHAVARLRTRFLSLHVVLIGDGPSRAVLERLVGALGLTSVVHFLGEREATDNLHAGCDIAVLCSRSEGFPNALIEAMAAGCPVVATAVGGIVDAVTDRVTGLLVPAGDSSALAAGLSRLIEDAPLRTRLADAGRAAVWERFHVDKVIPQLVALYRQREAGQ